MTSLGIRGYIEVKREGRRAIMIDLLYILIAILFFLGCWAFTKACDRL